MKYPMIATFGLFASVTAFSLGVTVGQENVKELAKKPSQMDQIKVSKHFSLLCSFFEEQGSTNPVEFAVICSNSEIPHLLASVAAVESNANPKAKSRKGAIGAWQVVPKWHGHVRDDIPGQAAQAERILLTLLEDNDMYTALRKYNAGNNYQCREAKEYATKVLDHYAKLVVHNVDN